MAEQDPRSVATVQREAYDHHRLLRLEGRLRLTQGLAALALVVAVAAVLALVLERSSPRYTAHAFSVTDADGQVVAQLGMSSEGRPGLYVYDGPDRTTRLWLGLAQDGSPRLVLAGPEGENLLSMGLDPEHDGQPRLYLQDASGTTRFAAGVAADGHPGLVFMDAEGQPTLALPPGGSGSPEERWAKLNDAGTRAFVQGRLAEAERLYAAAAQVARALGGDDLRLAATLNNLGALYVRADRLDAADQAYQQSLAIRRGALGEGHPQVAQSLANMAFLRRAQGLPTEAEALYRRAIALWEQQPGGQEDGRLVATLTGYADLLESRGRGEEAARRRERAEAIRARLDSVPEATGGGG